MNKKIKRAIAVLFTISAFSTFSGATNFINTKVYASTSDAQLRSIYLSDGTIDFSSSTYSYTVNVGSSVDEIRISARPKNSDAIVEIDGTKVDDGNNYREIVSLNRGKNTIKIKVTDDDDEDYVKTYTLTVYRGNTDRYDDIYLKSLHLSEGDIDFDKYDTSYSTSVSSSIDRVTITAKPEESYSRVRINGGTVTDDEDYKKTVNLSIGENQIDVDVQDGEEIRTYKLNITRGSASTTGSASATEKVKVTNQWIEVNGKLQYVDALGNPLKNSWLLDKGIGRYYYLNSDGNKSIGWLYNNFRWYLLDSNGIMQTGWNFINGNWYYLESSGAMKTGWFIYGNKYYHLSNSGVMDHDTIFEGYRLGTDGAWIGR